MTVTEVPDGALVALDTVPLVYFLERHPIHFEPVRALLERVEDGRLRAVVSSLVFAELLVPAHRAGDARRAAQVVRTLEGFPNLDIVPVTAAIASDASRLRAQWSLRTPDAIHAANALAAGADGIVTNDRDFRKMESELSVWWLEPPGPPGPGGR